MVVFKQKRTYFMETKKIDFTNLFWYYFLKCYVFIYQVSSITKKKPEDKSCNNFFKSACSFSYGEKNKNCLNFLYKCYVFIYQVSSITKKNPRTNPAAIFKECLLIFMWGKNKIA